MFGHQDDQHHHHDDDNKIEDVLSQPAVDSVLSTEHHDATTVHEDFNPAAPADAAVFAPAAAASADDQAVTPASDSTSTAPVTPAQPLNHDLLSIKQQVLTSLSPLVDHLDQTPEEKFRTTMMMIQASDDHSLIKNAYEAAQTIPDEKVKAQALLDIVNEINYFTQHAA